VSQWRICRSRSRSSSAAGTPDTSSSTSGAPLAAASSAGAANPFAHASAVTVGRTDQGVDVSMAPGSRIDAPLPSRVVRVDPNWYAGQPAVFFQVTDGPNKGKFWFLAEQIVPHVKVGDTVAAGEQVATYASQGTAIEMGWAANATETLARATTGYVEGQVTVAGQSFRNFLHQLGVS
jgi:biotin carboxyl carrier protein